MNWWLEMLMNFFVITDESVDEGEQGGGFERISGLAASDHGPTAIPLGSPTAADSTRAVVV
jgi:hypothetical protein